MKNKRLLGVFLISTGLAHNLKAMDINSYLQSLEMEAKTKNPSFKGFSEVSGKTFYFKDNIRGGKMVSCSACHSENPKNDGKTRANKRIEPLAPIANPKRFTDLKEIEKWFRRNCRDVLERECTLSEKGDLVLFLKYVK